MTKEEVLPKNGTVEIIYISCEGYKSGVSTLQFFFFGFPVCSVDGNSHLNYEICSLLPGSGHLLAALPPVQVIRVESLQSAGHLAKRT